MRVKDGWQVPGGPGVHPCLTTRARVAALAVDQRNVGRPRPLGNSRIRADDQQQWESRCLPSPLRATTHLMSSCALRNGTRSTPLESSRWKPRGLGRQPVIIAPPWSSASGGPFGEAEPARDSPQLPFDGRLRAVKRVPPPRGGFANRPRRTSRQAALDRRGWPWQRGDREEDGRQPRW